MSVPARITAKELQQKLDHGENIFILDVRNEDEYNEWKIEGKNVESANIPYFDFLEEEQVDQHAASLPKDREMVIVCAKGGSSDFIADLMRERGFEAYSLEGGMLDWSQLYTAKTAYVDEDVKLIQINRLAKGCLSYMLISEGKAAVIDPGRHVEEYERIAERENAVIEHVLDTHLHADHISGGQELAKKPVPRTIFLPANCRGESWISNRWKTIRPFASVRPTLKCWP